MAVTADADRLAELELALKPSGVAAAAGPEALLAAASEPVDWAMSAIVGAAGLAPGLRLAEHGGVLALANKESMVCAGELLKRTCAAHGTRLIPVDSEHSAIFQALQGERVAEVERIILTASGGPFRDWPIDAHGDGDAGRGAGRIPTGTWASGSPSTAPPCSTRRWR